MLFSATLKMSSSHKADGVETIFFRFGCVFLQKKGENISYRLTALCVCFISSFSL